MTETPNHKYNAPAKGTDDWHIPLNDNWDRLDSDIEIRDAEANLSAYDPRAGAKFLATDTENEFVADGKQWLKLASSGRNPIFGSVSSNQVDSKNINNEVYASQFDGNDLSAKVLNALNALPSGQGRVRVTAKDGGTPWEWTQALSLSLFEYNGVHIDIDENVKIEFTTSDYPLTVDGAQSDTNYSDYSEFVDGPMTERQSETFSLTGGVWHGTASDVSGWLRLRDQFGPLVDPTMVTVKNDTDDATAIRVENIDMFVEGARYKGHYDANIGFDAYGASHTSQSGNGSDSFQNSVFDQIHINATNKAMHLRGEWMWVEMIQPAFFAKADNCTLLTLDGGLFSGLTIDTPKFEDPALNKSGVTAIRTTDAYDIHHTPLILNPKFAGMATTQDFGDRYGQQLTVLQNRKGRLQVGTLGTDAKPSLIGNWGPPGLELDTPITANSVQLNAQPDTTVDTGGQAVFDGTDVQVHSGGQVRNLSDVGSPLDWTEDPNSPLTVTDGDASSELTYTLAGEYEEVLVTLPRLYGDAGSSSNGTNLKMRVQGTVDGDNLYYYQSTDGTTTEFTDAFVICQGADLGTPEQTPIGEMRLTGRWPAKFGIRSFLGIDEGTMLSSGTMTQSSSPLMQFSLFWATGNIAGTVRVFGRDMTTK